MSRRVTNWGAYPNFIETEFICRCGRCDEAFVSETFLDMLQHARTISGIPFRVMSGCRCVSHNSTVSRSLSGDHVASGVMLCFGADIACTDETRELIVAACREAGMNRFGRSKNFVHVGIGKRLGGRNADDVEWEY